MTDAYDRLLDALENVKHPNGNQDKARANCPAHDSASRSSLSIKRAEGKVLVYCFGGCPVEQILDVIGWSKADLYDDHKGNVYAYPDGAYAHRSYDRNGKKQFYQSGNLGGDSTKLYRLSSIEIAKFGGQAVWLVEGEDDVHALEILGVLATTTRGGVGMMGKADLSPLYGARVNAVVDKDKAGDKWAQYMRTMLEGKTKSLTFVQAKTGKDAQDHVAADHEIEDFQPYEFPPEEPDGDQSGRYLKVVRASDIGMEATCWLWEDDQGKWLPQGAVALCAGREGVGKSTVVADVVARITNGTLPGEHFGTPKHVIICATEDSWKQTINPRLVAAAADLTKVIRVDAYTPEGFEGTLQLPEDIERVREIVAEHDVVMIVLDPLMSTLSASLDSHKDAEVRRGLEPLSRLAHTANLTVLGLIHENKSSASDLLSRIMGSRAFSAVVRAVLYCARREEDPEDQIDQEFYGPPEPQFVFGQAKSNLGRMVPHAIRYTIDGVHVGFDEQKNKAIWSSRIVWGTTEDQSVQEIVKAQESVKRDAKVTEAKRWLKDYLKGKGEVPSDALLKAGEALGHTRSTVQRARGLLRISVKPVGSKTTWSLLDS